MPDNEIKPAFYIQTGNITGAITPESVVDKAIEGSREQFEKIANLIEEASTGLINKLKDSAYKPSECSLEFGVEFKVAGGIPWVTKGELGAAFKVSVKWENK